MFLALNLTLRRGRAAVPATFLRILQRRFWSSMAL
jgi:hypothetical protein